MAYSEQYYYYYKYPHYQISVGVPVGIGVCVLLVCLSVMCQKKKKQLRAQEEEEEARQAIKDESADYHAMTDVVASSDEGSGGAGEGGFGSKPRSTSPNRPILDAGGQSPSALGAVRGSSQFVRAEANPLSRFEEIGGDWVGFSFRAGSVAAVDSLYFQMRGVMAVGAHQDHVGSYTVDGIINPRERSVSFNKTYASSRATVEYDCDLWAEPGSEHSLTVMIGKWAGRGARGSCVLFNKHRHLKLFEWLERVRENQPQLLGGLSERIDQVLECRSYDQVVHMLR